MSTLLTTLLSRFTTCACGSSAHNCAIAQMQRYVNLDDTAPEMGLGAGARFMQHRVSSMRDLPQGKGEDDGKEEGEGRAGIAFRMGMGEKMDLGPLVGRAAVGDKNAKADGNGKKDKGGRDKDKGGESVRGSSLETQQPQLRPQQQQQSQIQTQPQTETQPPPIPKSKPKLKPKATPKPSKGSPKVPVKHVHFPIAQPPPPPGDVSSPKASTSTVPKKNNVTAASSANDGRPPRKKARTESPEVVRENKDQEKETDIQMKDSTPPLDIEEVPQPSDAKAQSSMGDTMEVDQGAFFSFTSLHFILVWLTRG